MSFNTALIVDDSKLARIALKKKLEKRGLEIVMAEDARQALGLLENSSIDIVFMDHLMPEMDGFEATQEIKANSATAHLPVIMCSGKEKQGYLEEARAIGASNVLPKPAENEAIAAVFAELEALGAADVPPASEETAAAAPAVSEAQIHNWLQPLSEQLGALSAQLISQAKSTDDRFATVADSVQLVEARQSAIESPDMEQFKQECLAHVDQRFTQIALPDTAQIHAQLKQELADELASQMGAQWDSKLSASVAGLEERIAAGDSDSGGASPDEWLAQAELRIIGQMSESFNKLLEDKSQQLEASLQQSVEQSLQQQIASMREQLSEELTAEFSAASQAPTAEAELDVEALKQGLKHELIAELQQQAADAAASTAEITQDVEAADTATADGEQAVSEDAVEENEQAQPAVSLSQDPQLRQELTTMKMLTLATSLVAIAATALHWF